MKKMSYEYLIITTNDLYQRLDRAAVALCGLKESISKMSNLLKTEYEAKYKGRAEKDLEN